MIGLNMHTEKCYTILFGYMPSKYMSTRIPERHFINKKSNAKNNTGFGVGWRGLQKAGWLNYASMILNLKMHETAEMKLGQA